MAWTLVAALCLCSVALVTAVDVNAAKEQKCFNVSTVPADPEFLGKLSTVYYPLLGKLELYRTAGDVYGKDPSKIPESMIYYDSCMRWGLYSNGSIIGYGFDGMMREYAFKPIKPGMESFDFRPREGKGFSGTAYTAYTDNKTYFITAFCTDDGEMTWAAGSIHPTFPKETELEVRKKVKELGFMEDYITEVRYDYCDLDTMEATTTSS